MRCNILDDSPIMDIPITLAKSFEVTAKNANGEIIASYQTTENKKRNILIPVGKAVKEICFKINENWGNSAQTAVFAFELY
jgi:hypothetical protein